MHLPHDSSAIARRHFLKGCPIGLASMALANLEARGGTDRAGDPLSLQPSHHSPRAKSVIYLFMAGGPSQLDLFDRKPDLNRLHGQPIPESFVKGKRFAFMNTFSKERPKLLASPRRFRQNGQSGAWISELLPNIGSVADKLTMIRSMNTNVFNHAPAKMFANTGSPQTGRPSIGSWVTYGLGSPARDLPGFIVLQSGPRGPRGGMPLWGSGFLPSSYQGVPFRSTGDPVLNLSTPAGIDRNSQERVVNTIGGLNRLHLEDQGDPEIAARTASYEMAFRMQVSAPDLIDIGRESKSTLARYGATPGQPSFAANCLLARRLVERGVRFVQLYHADWDHHGGPDINLERGLERVCREIDQPCAALVNDLASRGLLEDTIVVWGGEFGRTPMGEIRETVGRNHHIDAYTMWVAGGGFKPGIQHGETDELGFSVAKDKVHVHDLHATLLHQLGLNHERLTYRFQGRDFRLTDIAGNVVAPILN
ncbi:MAG: DUF1501 domain-containing protein [Planctomycetes bacterium]|nr:DUF1501 domain-containing protein [Planctomycetota bacterium]